MFGYVKALPSELKVKEYDFYKSVYCGLCRCMGRQTGGCSRMTLSYDFVFLALVRLSVSDEEIKFEKKRCMLKKSTSAVLSPCPSLRYCARAAAVLNYYKVYDDLHDSKGFRKLACRAVLPHLRRAEKKADMSELDHAAHESIYRLFEIESKEKFSPDEAAEEFGTLLSAFFRGEIEDPDISRILSEFGRHIGRWIYYADAADDFGKDLKKGRKNPLICEFGGSFGEAEKKKIRTAMTMELYEAEKAMNLLPFRDRGIENIVKNIIYFGMPAIEDRILGGK